MIKKLKVLLLLAIITIPMFFEFNVFAEDDVEFLDTSNLENVLRVVIGLMVLITGKEQMHF